MSDPGPGSSDPQVFPIALGPGATRQLDRQQTPQPKPPDIPDAPPVGPPDAADELGAVLANLGADEEDKPSQILSQVQSMDAFMAEWKIVSTLGHIATFIREKDTKTKLAYLVCILENYQSGSLVEMFSNNVRILPYIESLFKWLYGSATAANLAPPVEECPPPQGDAAQLELLFDGVYDFQFDPLAPIEEQNEPARSKLEQLDKMMPILRPILGFAAFFACSFGFHKLLDSKWITDTSKSVVQLAATIRAKRIIKEEVETGVDSLLSLFYGAFGEKYYSPAQQRLQEFNARVNQLYTLTRNYATATKIDAFGVLRIENIQGLNKLVAKYEKELSTFSEHEKTLFNFVPAIQKIRQNIDMMITRRDALIMAGGKQVPVTVWLAGKPGMGKTFLATKLANAVGKTVYTRSPFVEYWNNYANQTTVIFDDMLQNPDSCDAGEWMTYATCNAGNVNMAELAEKGTPFTSRFMIASSNLGYLDGHKNVTSVAAFHRRRDYLVYVSNPAVDLYVSRMGVAPPPEYYEQHPTRYLLYKPHPKVIFDDYPHAQTEGFIGEVTFAELTSMCIEKEKANAEAYRLSLLASGVSEHIHLPAPIAYERRKFDPDLIFRNGAVQYNIINPPPLPEVDDEDDGMGDDDATSFTGTEATDQALNFNPVKSYGHKKGLSLLITGVPGVGKSALCKAFVAKGKYKVTQITEAHCTGNWLNPLLTSTDIIFFDDITTSEKFCDAYKAVLTAIHDGDAQCAGVLATANPATAVWKGDTIKLITRRSTVIDIGLRPTYALRYKLSSAASVDKYVGDLVSKCKSKVWDDFFEIRVSYPRNAVQVFKRTAFIQLPIQMDRFFAAAMQKEKVFIHSEFMIPFPQHFDVMVEMEPFEERASPSAIIASVSKARISERRQDGTMRILSMTESIQALVKLAPLFHTKAYGSADEFTSIFNKENHQAVIPQHVLVKIQGRCIIGFVPVDGVVRAYGVDPNYRIAKVQMVGDQLYVNDELIQFTTDNEQYKRAVARCFKAGEDAISLVGDDTINVTKLFLRASPMGRFLNGVLSVVPVLIKGMACAAILNSIIPSSSSKEAVEEERMPRGVAQQKQEDPGEYPGGHPKAGQKRNRVYHGNESAPAEDERMKRAQAQQPQEDPGEYPGGHPKAGQPRTRVFHGKEATLEDDERMPRQVAQQKQEDPGEYPGGHPKAGEKRNRVYHGNEAEDPPTNEALTGAGYDKSRPKKAIVHNEAVNDNNQLVVSVKNQYGFTWNQLIYFANEVHRGTWRIDTSPITNEWKAFAPEKLPSHYVQGSRRVPLEWKAEVIKQDHGSLAAAIGETFVFHEDDPLDFGSLFACSHVYGIPYDIDNGKIVINKLPQIFHPHMRTRAPRRLLDLLFKHFRKEYEKLSVQEIQQEGMYDPNLFAFCQDLHADCVELLIDDKHVVFGIRIGQNKIISVAHVQEAKLSVQLDKLYQVKFVQRHSKSDIAVYEIVGNIPAYRDISHKFCTRAELQDVLAANMTNIAAALYVPYEPSTLISCGATAQVRRNTEIDGHTIGYSCTLGAMGISGVSMPGHCGSPLLLQNKQLSGKIIGIHRAGNTVHSLGSIVSREWVKEILKDSRAIDPTTPEAVVPIHYDKATLQLLETAYVSDRNGLLEIGSTVSPVYMPTTTRIMRTGIQLPKELDIFEPCLMSKHDPRSDGVFDPRHDGLRRYGESNNATLDLTEIDDAYEEIAFECATRIRAMGRSVRVFTKTEALNAPPFHEFPNANPIDRSGSAGFPYIVTTNKKSKKDFLRFNEPNQTWYFNNGDRDAQLISNKIDKVIQDAAAGIPHCAPFVSYVKDEPVKLKKIYDVRKTRIFFSGPFEYLIAYRMYFLSAMLRLQELHATLPPKIGISSDRDSWNTLAYSMLAVGTHGFATDVANFDSSVPTAFMEGALKVWNSIYTACPSPGADTAKENATRDTLHRAVEGAHVICGNKLYKLTQAQVSGNPGTAMENSFVIWALYYIVWKRLAKIHAPQFANYRSFRKNVALAIYGDDNICTVAPDCLPWFNYNSFAKEALTLGFHITDAAKIGGDIPDSIPLEKMEFLKRSFRKEQGYYCGPLAQTSLAKAVMWIHDTESYEVTKNHLEHGFPISLNLTTLKDSLLNTMTEVALHGKKVYQEWIDMIVPEAGRIGVEFVPPRWQAAMALKGYLVY